MQMHNLPHPGTFIEGVYLEPCALSTATVQRLVASKSSVSPDVALRLSRVLGRSAESWLAMQDSFDLWQARQSLDLSGLTPMELTGRGAPGFQAAAAPGQGGCGQDCC